MAKLIGHLDFKLKKLKCELMKLRKIDGNLSTDIIDSFVLIEEEEKRLKELEEQKYKTKRKMRIIESNIRELEGKIKEYAPLDGQIDIYGNVIVSIKEG